MLTRIVVVCVVALSTSMAHGAAAPAAAVPAGGGVAVLAAPAAQAAAKAQGATAGAVVTAAFGYASKLFSDTVYSTRKNVANTINSGTFKTQYPTILEQSHQIDNALADALNASSKLVNR
jgi:hypothetical protein